MTTRAALALSTLLSACAAHRVVEPAYASGALPGYRLAIRVIGETGLGPYKDPAYAGRALDCAVEALAQARLADGAAYLCGKLAPYVESQTQGVDADCASMRAPTEWTSQTITTKQDSIELLLPPEGQPVINDDEADVVLLLEHVGVGCGVLTTSGGAPGASFSASSATLDVFWSYALWDNQTGALMAAGTTGTMEALSHLMKAPPGEGLPTHRYAMATMVRGTGLAR